jgi:hypothetical protein
VGKPPGAFGGELSPRPRPGCATRAGEPAATRLLPATDSLLAARGSFYCGLSATPSALTRHTWGGRGWSNFCGEKKFRGYQWEPNPGPRESKLPPYHPARLHTWTQTPPLLLTYRPRARPSVSGEPTWRQRGGVRRLAVRLVVALLLARSPRPQAFQRQPARGHPEQPPRFFVERTRASGEPLVGTKSSHLGSLWKNTCRRRAVCGQPEQPSRFFVERTCVRAFK